MFLFVRNDFVLQVAMKKHLPLVECVQLSQPNRNETHGVAHRTASFTQTVFVTTGHHQSSHLWLNSFLFSIKKKRATSSARGITPSLSFSWHTHTHTHRFASCVDYLRRSIDYIYWISVYEAAENVHALVYMAIIIKS